MLSLFATHHEKLQLPELKSPLHVLFTVARNVLLSSAEEVKEMSITMSLFAINQDDLVAKLTEVEKTTGVKISFSSFPDVAAFMDF